MAKIRHFDGPEKAHSRSLIVSFADEKRVEVKRIFTLPDTHGHCARLFRSTWPDAHIVGLDRERINVRDSDLVYDERRKSAKQCLNEHLHGNVSDLIKGHAVGRRVWRKNLALDNGVAPYLRRRQPKLANFDLIYLDYTALPSPRLKREILRFVDRFANTGAVVAVTMTMNGFFERDARDGLPEEAIYHPYRNAQSRMCLMVWQA